MKKKRYRLSLPLPPDATVLFVTDRMDKEEISNVIQSAGGWKLSNILPYLLALVSTADEVRFQWGSVKDGAGLKVIYLHQEKV